MPSWNTNLRYVTVPPWAIEYFEAYKKGKLRRHGEAVTEDPVFDEDTGWSVSWCPFVQALCEGDDLTHKRADFIVRETLGCADISLDELRAWRERADESSVSRLVDLFLEGSDA